MRLLGRIPHAAVGQTAGGLDTVQKEVGEFTVPWQKYKCLKEFINDVA